MNSGNDQRADAKDKSGGLTRAVVTDPRHVRVLAHPGRLALLWRLESDGAATATECARLVGMSPSAASYHLRQLARYGFVRPAPGRPDRRERVWESANQGFRIDESPTDEAVLAAEVELIRAAASSSDELTERWLRQYPDETPDWRAAAMMAIKGVRVTTGELREIYAAIAALVNPYLAHRRSVTDAPPDARLVHIDVRMFPWQDAPTRLRPPE